MKKYLVLLVSIAPFLFGASCGKKPVEKPTYYMSQEFKDYILFPVGSWWVYENPETGKEDSLYLFWQDLRIVDGEYYVGWNYENFQQHFTSSLGDTIFGGGGAELVGDNQPCTYYEGSLINFLNVDAVFFSDRDTGCILPRNQNIKYLTLFDNVEIQNYKYHSVMKFQILNQKYPLQPKQIYYAPHVGVIKKELFDGTVWELKRYYINQ